MASIRRDLSLGLGATILLVGVAAGVFYYAVGMAQMERALERQLLREAEDIADALAFPLWNLDHDAIEYICRARLQGASVSGLQVTEEDGSVLFSAGVLDAPGLLRADEPVRYRDFRIGRVRIALNRDSLNEVRSSVIGAVTLVLVFVVGTAILASQLLLKRYLSAPLERVQDGVERLERGDYGRPIPAQTRQELAGMVLSFNALAAKLARREQEVAEHASSQEKANELLRREVQERKRAEEQLRSARNAIKNILDSMPSYLVTVDTKGRVQDWNAAMEDRMGLPPAIARDRPLDQVFPGLPVSPWDVRAAVEGARPVVRTKQPAHKNDGHRYYDVVVYPLAATGGSAGGGAVVRLDDVTDRARMEDMMVQTEKMLSVGGLAAGMAHEINNPLGIILQGVQGVLRRISPDIQANLDAAEEVGVSLERIGEYLKRREILDYLDGVQDAGQRAARIVANMLNFSRQGPRSQEPCDLNDLLEKTIELAANDYDLKKKYDFRKIRVERDLDPDLSAVVCTVTEMEQVFLNLLRNAAQALGEAELDRKPRIGIRTHRENGWAVVEISDNGPGMDEATRKRVFEPFFTTKKPGVGTGLGLSVSYFIVTQNHKGTFTVDTAEGEGARFTIRLPL